MTREQEIEMNAEQDEASKRELNEDELDRATGGIRKSSGNGDVTGRAFLVYAFG